MTAVLVSLKADTSEDPPISPRTEPEWSIRIADRPSNTGRFLQEMVMAFSNASKILCLLRAVNLARFLSDSNTISFSESSVPIFSTSLKAEAKRKGKHLRIKHLLFYCKLPTNFIYLIRRVFDYVYKVTNHIKNRHTFYIRNHVPNSVT